MRHAPLHVKFKALCFNRARPQFQLVFVELVAAFALAQQGREREFVIRAALRNLGVTGLSSPGPLCFSVEDKDRRLVGRVVCLFLVLVFDFGPASENIAPVGEANRLGRFI